VIGVGLDYDEAGNPPEKMWKAFRLAAKAGLRRTAHACEYMEPPEHVETCIDLLGCERIDHGYRIILGPEITKRCADEGIVFTAVPALQIYGGYGTPKEWEEHGLEASEFPYPIKTMFNRGLRITFNSDDPGIMQIDLLQDYAMAAEDMGFGPGDFKTVILNGIDGAWLGETTKRQWTREWSREIDGMIEAIGD
jgi:adenosine deaminase